MSLFSSTSTDLSSTQSYSPCPFFSSIVACINSLCLSCSLFSFVFVHAMVRLCVSRTAVLTWPLWISFHVPPVAALIWWLFKQQIGPRRFPNRPTIRAYNYILRRYLSVSPAIIAFSATVLTQFCSSGLCGLHLTLPVKGSVFKSRARRGFMLSAVLHVTQGASSFLAKKSVSEIRKGTKGPIKYEYFL